MSPLIETIRVLDGKPNNLGYHQRRMQAAFNAFANKAAAPDLATAFLKLRLPKHGLHKCRVIYDKDSVALETEPYEMRRVNSLKLVEDNGIDYGHKFQDRTALKELFDRRGNCDDVLIVKNGLVTDTFYANVMFRRDDQWVTPSSYLLAGTCRHYLLDSGLVVEERIRTNDLKHFSACKLINSMLLTNGPEIAVEHIY